MNWAAACVLTMLAIPPDSPLFTLGGHPGRVGYSSVAFSPDGLQVRTLHPSGRLVTFDAASGRLLRVDWHDELANARLTDGSRWLSPDGQFVLLRGDAVRVRALPRLTLQAAIRDGATNPALTRLSANGKLLVTVNELDRGASRIRIAKVPYGETQTLKTIPAPLIDVAVSPDAQHVAVLDGTTARRFDTTTGHETWRLDTTATQILFTADSQECLLLGGPGAGGPGAGGLGMTALRVMPGNGVSRSLREVSGEPTGRAAVSPDGRWLAIPIPTHVLLYDLRADRLQSRLPCPDIRELAFSPDSRRLAMSNLWLTVWDLDANRAIIEPPADDPNFHPPHRLQFHPNGRELGVINLSGRFSRWSLQSPEPIARLDSGWKHATLTAVPGGWAVRSWEAQPHEQLITTHVQPARPVKLPPEVNWQNRTEHVPGSWSRDGHRAFCRIVDQSQHPPQQWLCWNTQTGAVIRRLPITAELHFSPGGRWAVSPGPVHVATGSPLPRRPADADVQLGAVRAVGLRIAIVQVHDNRGIMPPSGIENDQWGVMELATGRLGAIIAVPASMRFGGANRTYAPGEPSAALALSDDDRLVAFVTPWKLRVYDTLTAKEVCHYDLVQPIADSEAAFFPVAFSPDRQLLAVGQLDGSIAVYPVPPTPSQPKFADAQAALLALGHDDPKIGRAAVEQLVATPSAVTLIASTLPKPEPIEPADIPGLITRLASPIFPERDAASRRLRLAGRRALPELRQKLLENPPPEVRNRIEDLVRRHRDWLTPHSSGEAVRVARGVEVLERIASPEARTVLTAAAEQEANGPLAEEAQLALARLQQK